MSELLPCPFCGSTNIGQWSGPNDAYLCVRCNDCEANSNEFAVGEEAIKRWNTRTAAMPEAAAGVSVDQYIQDWIHVLYDATGDMTKVNRAVELADLNGLFDPIKFAALRNDLSKASSEPVSWPVYTTAKTCDKIQTSALPFLASDNTGQMLPNRETAGGGAEAQELAHSSTGSEQGNSTSEVVGSNPTALAKLNWGQLVQAFMRVMDSSTKPESTAKLCERLADVVVPSATTPAPADTSSQNNAEKLPNREAAVAGAGAFTLSRDVTKVECPWLDDDIPKGTVLFKYSGHTYGCIGTGIAVTWMPGQTPFFEIPRDAPAAITVPSLQKMQTSPSDTNSTCAKNSQVADDPQRRRVRGKFRKKPVEITAEQFKGVGYYEARGLPYPKGVCFCGDSQSPHAHVHTIHLHQLVRLSVDDWIIPEPDGEHFYPCKPDIFAATYDPVEDASLPIPDRAAPDGAGVVGVDFLPDTSKTVQDLKSPAPDLRELRDQLFAELESGNITDKTAFKLNNIIHGIDLKFDAAELERARCISIVECEVAHRPDRARVIAALTSQQYPVLNDGGEQ